MTMQEFSLPFITKYDAPGRGLGKILMQQRRLRHKKTWNCCK